MPTPDRKRTYSKAKNGAHQAKRKKRTTTTRQKHRKLLYWLARGRKRSTAAALAGITVHEANTLLSLYGRPHESRYKPCPPTRCPTCERLVTLWPCVACDARAMRAKKDPTP